MVRFSIRKKGFEEKIVLYHLRIKPGAVLLEGRLYWGEYGITTSVTSVTFLSLRMYTLVVLSKILSRQTKPTYFAQCTNAVRVQEIMLDGRAYAQGRFSL